MCDFITQSILRRQAYVSCREYDGTSQRAWDVIYPVKQGGTADKRVYSSLTERDSVRDVFFAPSAEGAFLCLSGKDGIIAVYRGPHGRDPVRTRAQAAKIYLCI